MTWWIISLITLLIYQMICFVIILILETISPSKADDFAYYLCCGLAFLPFILIIKAIKSIRNHIRFKYGIILVQKNREDIYHNEFVPCIAKYKDIEHFENSSNWHIYRKYPTKAMLKAGYTEKNEVTGEVTIRTYDLKMISDDELEKVKTEPNCFHCKYEDTDECTEDEPRCGYHDWNGYKPK